MRVSTPSRRPAPSPVTAQSKGPRRPVRRRRPKVMRKLKLLVVVLLGLALVLPYWVGREAEKAFLGKAAALSSSHDGQIDVLVLKYERGWFRSAAQTRVTVPGTTPDEGLLLNHDIVHGPVPLGEVAHGEVPLRLAGAVVYSHDAPPPNRASTEHSPFMTLRTEVGFRENFHIDYDLSPYQDAPNGFEWGGLHGFASIPTTGVPTLQFDSPGLRAARGGFSVDIGEMAVRLEMESSANGIPLGQATVEAKHVLFEQKRRGRGAPRQLDIRDLTWTQEVTESVPGETLDLSVGARFGTVRGWASRIQEGEWYLICRGLDSQALRQVRLASRGAEPLARIVSRSPRFETRFTLTTTDGVIEGAGDMTTESSLAALEAGAPPSRLPTEWFITIFFSPAVLEPTRLDPIWQANILSVDGERYRLTARYRQGLVDLNGAIVSLKDFGASLLLLLDALRL